MINLDLKEEFTSSISFKKEDSDRWQLIGSSQNYGTNYGIYAKIICDYKLKIVTQINLKIINYKGAIRLGIYDADAISVIDLDSGKPTGNMNIYVRVQALNIQSSYPIKDKKIPYDNKNGKIESERILMPMYILDKAPSRENRAEYFEREITSPFKKNSDNNKVCYQYSYIIDNKGFGLSDNEYDNLPERIKTIITDEQKRKQMIFDTEFFYADGDKFVLPKYDYDEDPDERATEILYLSPGFRCKMGTFKIL
jgi:hypothetical protein